MLELTETQIMIRDMAARFVQDRYSIEKRREIVASPGGYDAGLWKELADLGLLGLLVSEENGGFGGGGVELMLMMNAIGSGLVVEPYLPVAVMAAQILDRAGHADLLGELIAGTALPVLAHFEPHAPTRPEAVEAKLQKAGENYRLSGAKSLVPFAAAASHYIVSCREGDSGALTLALVSAKGGGIQREDCVTLDGRRVSELAFDDVEVAANAILTLPEGQNAVECVTQIIDDAILGVCAEGVSIAWQMHEQTLDYVKQRNQFGVAIGSFQAIQHKMVEMYTEAQMAQSIVEYASSARDARTSETTVAISAAKIRVAKALKFVGQHAVQFHGGMGMTEELALAHYFRRASFLEHQFGTADQHFARFEAMGGFPAIAA
ncbi:acyl-CoA dehydrogenase family protein [Blastomonas sp. UPD001]|uniref:acyl-CoA dehydrogenase family protein n=1 Tax=Blastomonas sp. UPD001 TaxID=2217673 RepID=UPI000E354D36|nr:acyl-CoA dehydrogenase family protein [Blastomonas sp. UPD001]